MKFEWFVASRYLLSRRKQSFISIISIISIVGVSLGVATVILVIAVLDGVEHGLRDRFLARDAHVALGVLGNSFFGDYNKKIEDIKKVPGVVAASPVLYSQTAVFQKDRNNINDVILIKGIDPELEEKVTGFSQFVKGSIDFQNTEIIEEASFFNDVKITGGIVLGTRLAERLGVNEGDVIRLVVRMVEDQVNPDALYPIIRHFVVIGLYESELAVYDNQISFIHLDIAQKTFEQTGKVNVILVRLENAELAPEIAPLIEQAPEFDPILLPITTTWLETHAPLFAALELEKIATVIIEALIILVAAFNIASTLIMTVMEKTRDIGTLRTLGSTRGNIMRIFMIQGSVIGMMGTLLGTTLGLYVCWLLSSNMTRLSPLIAVGVIAILSLCQIGITFRNIDFAGIGRNIFFLIVSVLALIVGNFVIIAGIFILRDDMDWLLSLWNKLLSITALVLPFEVPYWLLVTIPIPLMIGVISFLIFWIVIMIKSWSKMSPKWRMAFIAPWFLAIVFVLFCLVEPISLEELGLSQIYQMNHLPIKVNWFFVFLMNLLSLEICWLATIYPAWQASKLNPIEALQYE